MANEKLLQITDNGPVKVLGRGTNGWTEKWGSGSGSNALEGYWNLWKDFPTAIQVGDLVWVMHDCKGPGGGEFSAYMTARWTLAAINVREGGKNVAYPGVTNNTDVGGTSTYQIDATVRSTLTNPTPYLNITYPNGIAPNSQNYSSRMLSHSGYNSNRVYPQFTGSDVTHYFVRSTSTSGTHSDYVHGLGYKCVPIGETFNAAMIFPPIRYKWQFEELYGKESDWVTITSGYDIWKDTYPSGTTDVYPYEFEEPSESLFRDVAGDTTGDGVDDSAIAVAALAAAAAVVTLPSLDVSACKLDINTKALDDTFSSLKDSLLGAVDTSGLSALASKATKLKDSLLSNLPELPEFPDFASQFASLDFNNPIDVEALKEKWGNIVPDIGGMIDKIKFDPGSFSICAVSDIKAEVQDDGSYVQVVTPPPVVVPREKPKEVEKTTVKVEESIEEPQSTFEIDFGVNPKMASAGSKIYLSAWKELANDSQVTSNFDAVLIEAAWERRIALRRDGEYAEFKRRVSEKKPLGDLKKFIDEEDTMCRALDFAKTYHSVLANAQRIVSNHVIQYAGYFYSVGTLPDYTDLVSKALTEYRFPRGGQVYIQLDAVHAAYSQSDLDEDLAFASLINNKVKEYIWKKDIIQNYAIKGIVYPKENTNLTKEVPSIYVS